MVGLDFSMTPPTAQLNYPGNLVEFTAVFENKGNTNIDLGALSGTIKFGTTTKNLTFNGSNNQCITGYELSQTEKYTCTFKVDVSGASGNYTIKINTTGSETDGIVVVPVTDSSQITVKAPPISYIYLPLLTNKYRASDEPNNTCETAYPLEFGTSYSFMPNDKTDIYTFDLSSTSNLNIRLTNFTPIQGQIALFYGSCPAPSFVANNGQSSATKTLNLTNQPAGTYFLLVINDGAFSTTSSYNLTITKP
jgi:hypothetical protein